MIELWSENLNEGLSGEFYGSDADESGLLECQPLGDLTNEASSGIIHGLSDEDSWLRLIH